MRIDIAGENSLILYFEQPTLLESNLLVTSLVQEIANRSPIWLVDMIPSYHSLLVIFDPYQTDYLAVKSELRQISIMGVNTQDHCSKIIELPVLYGYPQENDLNRIADLNQISTEQVINFHQRSDYRVYAIGFSPGFAFLGETVAEIATPRLSTPRTKVPKGAVAIADQQTAVYPSQSPGGWNIIGLCPSQLFDINASPPMLLSVGDTVRFIPIDEAAFVSLGGQL